MQSSFDHLTEVQLSSTTYLDDILSVLELKAGVREDDERRHAFKTIMYDGGRKKDESLGQYAMRRLRDYNQAATHGINIPAEFKASMLREGANISEQTQQNLTTLAASLARLDVRADRLSGFVYSSQGQDASYLAAEANDAAAEDEDDGSDSGEEELENAEQFYAELADLDMDEEQMGWVLATLDGRGFHKRRSWKENKKFKAEARKDRGSFVKGHAAAEAPRGQFGGAPGQKASFFKPRGPAKRGRMSVDELKKVTKCRLCHKRGHWSAECPTHRGGTGPENVARVSGFCYLGNEIDYQEPPASSFLAYATQVMGCTLAAASSSSWSFLTIPSAMGILDIGATQDLIGTTALCALEHELGKSGLRVIDIPPPSLAPTGIGGAAKVVRAVLAPISPGGVPGVVHFIVVQENIPPLLSVGFLEHLGASFDLRSNEINLQAIGVQMKMHLLPSGHRAIPLVQWNGQHFPVPPPARVAHGLTEDAVMKKSDSKASSTYAKSSGWSTRAQPGSALGESCDGLQESTAVSVSAAVQQSQSSVQCIAASKPQSAAFYQSTTSSGDFEPKLCVVDASLGSAVALMGNRSANTAPQFEPPRRNDGCPASFGGTDWDSRSAAAMEDVNGPRLLHVRDGSTGIPPTGGGRDHDKERPFRPQELLGEQQSGAGQMRALGRATAPCESICHVDGVSPVFSEAHLHLQEQPSQGTAPKASSCGRYFLDDSPELRVCRTNHELDTPDRDYKPECSTDGGDPPALAAGFQDIGASMRDLAQGQSRLLLMLNQASFSAGPMETLEEARRHDVNMAQRLEHESQMSVDGSQDDSSPQSWARVLPGANFTPEEGPSLTMWPRWMTLSMASLATSLIGWEQLSSQLQGTLSSAGGDRDCWADSISKVIPEDRFISQGPGAPQALSRTLGESHVTGERFWQRPRRLRLLESCRDLSLQPIGFDSEGALNTQGPYWLVRAPRLRDELDDAAEAQIYAEDHELYKAARGLEGLARDQARDFSGQTVDYAELFYTSSVIPLARASGLKTPPNHENFSEQAGWSEQKKEHRQRFRKFLRDRAPRLLGVSLRSSGGHLSDPTLATDQLRQGMAIEAVKEQLKGRRCFYLEDYVSSRLWDQPAWHDLVSENSVVFRAARDPGGKAVATNDPALARALFRQDEKDLCFQGVASHFTPLSTVEQGQLSDSEAKAYQLRAVKNYSRSACVKLLEATSWKDEPHTSGRGQSWRSEWYRTLGKFVHGGVSGLTRCSRHHQQLSLYLNEFLDFHGSSEPRTSITISKNARPGMHRDVNNLGRNSTMALGKFSGGQLWVEDPAGTLHRRDPQG
ncbi:GIP, partial [Symbiodinium sp. CCMP2456]